MANEITSDKLLKSLTKLKQTAEYPSLYLTNYFIELRNDVEKEIAAKQTESTDDEEKKNELHELCQKMVEKIDLFEKNCIRETYDLEAYKLSISNLETMLATCKKTIDLNAVAEEIYKNKMDLLRNIFQNRTIMFLKEKDEHENEREQVCQLKNKLIEAKLFLLSDEFFSKKLIQKR